MDNKIPQACDRQGHRGAVERAHTADMCKHGYTDNKRSCEPGPCTRNDVCPAVYIRIGNDEAHKGTDIAKADG